MSLYLKIDQDASANFFTLYDPLGRLEKKIWDAARWWVKKFPCAHPKQIKIADHIGCSRKHVNRAFSKFKSYGWLYLTSRGARRTKILGIPTHLIAMDLVNREYFKRIEVTSKVTHSSSRFPNTTSRTCRLKKEPLVIPKLAQKLGYSEDSGKKLALVPEYILQETLYQCQKMGKRGFKPDKEERYFVETALKMAQDKGHKLEWRRFYG